MKYIVIRIEDRTLVREYPVIFPQALVHEDVYRAMRLAVSNRGNKVSAVSAGFVNSMEIGSGSLRCYGYSETLKLKSREKEDESLIASLDYSHGIR